VELGNVSGQKYDPLPLVGENKGPGAAPTGFVDALAAATPSSSTQSVDLASIVKGQQVVIDKLVADVSSLKGAVKSIQDQLPNPSAYTEQA
jgi:hypothetical protein